MSRLTVQTFLSLDGVMQSPGANEDDREGGFELGGWLAPYYDDEMSQTVVALHGQADGLLLGRKTYEGMAAYWPTTTDDENPVASQMNRVVKYVASRTLDKVGWNNSRLIHGDLPDEVAALKRHADGEIQVVGSGALVQALMKHDLVDEYRLWIFPLLLGAGKRLFADGTVPAKLALVESSTFGSGAVMHTYRRGSGSAFTP